MGFEGYYKNVNCFTFLETQAAKELKCIERSERISVGERESHPLRQFIKSTTMLNKTIHWAPRITSLLFISFLSLFALDVFAEYQGLAVLLPLLMHLIPSFVLLVLVIIAWKYDLFGATVFLIAALGYVWMVGLNRPWSWYVGISGPAIIVALLFFISWYQKRKSTTKTLFNFTSIH